MIDARTETEAREKAWNFVKMLIAESKSRYPTRCTYTFSEDWDMKVYVDSPTKYEAYLHAVQDHPYRKGEKYINTEIEIKVL